MNIKEKIIDYLSRNRVSTTEVADCLGKAGAIEGIMPCSQGYYVAGEIEWMYTYGGSNWPLHEQIQRVEEDRIIFVDSLDCEGRAIFGELVSKYLLMYHKSRAIIVNGKIRDAAAILRQKWPIWCRGYTPVGCFNKEPLLEVDWNWEKNQKEKYNGAIAVCDDCGVVVIPSSSVSEDFLNKLIFIEDQEDIWFDRLDHYKESTFDIVCKKKYLADENYMKTRKNFIVR